MAPVDVRVTIENLAPANGTLLTPVWVGFHNGNFDTYDRGRPASPGLESIAEDGATDLISREFTLSGSGSVEGVIAGPGGNTNGPIDPGEIATATFTIDNQDPRSRFFNYAAMVLPSNDAFVANGNPTAHRIFDEQGNFIGAEFIVFGGEVLDAGTEVNDEAENSTAFFGQTVPNTGTPEDGLVQTHPGFIPNGRILSAPQFANGDFTASGYQVARITIGTANQPAPTPPDLIEVTVNVESLTPNNGTLLTPVWVGFHDGSFDTYDRGRPASPGLESIAEDGDVSGISREFLSSGAGLVDGTIAGPVGADGPIDPGETASFTFTVDRSLASSRYLNYASMVLPSNDAFIANGDPTAIEIIDENGNFLGANFVVSGSEVLDAGTEVNDEAANSTAFFGQTVPNTGTDQNGVVRTHPGFVPNGRILSAPQFSNGDFTQPGYQVARITVTTNDVPTVPLGARFQDNGRGEPIVDLRGIGAQQVQVSLAEVTSDAVFNNVVGLYAIEDTLGTVVDEFGNRLTPGDAGYAVAAMGQRVITIDQNTTTVQPITGGNLLAPFIIANNTVEQFLAQNPNNEQRDDTVAYFSFLGANPDRSEHVRLQGNNTFAFEDLAFGGDLDFNDLFFRAEFSVV
ncbi:MAG: spondin domain-containing protein [Prochloraceae cyanobacterium]|nr:spondin domain-containing protein [Prochloraceae cyanobacterium]